MIVVWRVSERCNLACSFCAYDRRVQRTRLEADADEVRRFSAVLKQYQDMTGDQVLVSWIGGEPLLWRPVFELSSLLANAHRIKVSATTNGTTLHLPAVRERVLASLNELTISVDGFEDFHDAIRGWPGGWQRLKLAVRALAAARAGSGKACKLRANIVLMHDNLPMFAELCEELADWGFDEITFNQLGGRDRPEFFPPHRLTPADATAFSALMPALQAKLALRAVRLCATSAYLQRIEASAGNRAITVPDCGPGEQFLFIDERQRISPCNFTSDELGVPLAGLLTGQDVLSLPLRFARARQARLPAACGDCPSTQVFAKFGSQP